MLASAFCGSVGVEKYVALQDAWLGRGLPKETLHVRLIAGRKFHDVLWAGGTPLISDRVLQFLSKEGITGWSTFPVEILDKAGRTVTVYHGFRVTGRCSMITLSKGYSELIYEQNPRGLFPHYKGIYFDKATWDGSDVFTSEDPSTAWVLATEQFKQIFESNRITNCEFTPISEVQLLASDQQPILTTDRKN
ncbi:MAG: hypothetical protein H7039_19560 [Bryobacteraceae bacterium]|nr:hypothetical protein [Bryobacteraceae bacterium]